MTNTEFEHVAAQQATIMEQQAEILRLRRQVRTLEGAYAALHVAYIKRTQLALGAALVRFVIADKV